MNSFTRPALPESASLLDACAFGPGARALILVVHPDLQSRRQPGYRFIGDVLRANGFAVLSFNLQAAESQVDDRAGEPSAQIDRLLEWAARRHADDALPVALLAVGDAVQAFVPAVARHGRRAVQSLVLLDGHPDLVRRDLGLLSQPTLFLVGEHACHVQASHRAANPWTSARHRLQVLEGALRRGPPAGVHEAVACAVAKWMRSTLPLAGTAR